MVYQRESIPYIYTYKYTYTVLVTPVTCELIVCAIGAVLLHPAVPEARQLHQAVVRFGDGICKVPFPGLVLTVRQIRVRVQRLGLLHRAQGENVGISQQHVFRGGLERELCGGPAHVTGA